MHGNTFQLPFSAGNPGINETALTQLLIDVMRMENNGRIQWHGATPPRWSYPRSIYFALSIITTIGKRLHLFSESLFQNRKLVAPNTTLTDNLWHRFRFGLHKGNQVCFFFPGFGNLILKTSQGRLSSVLYAIVGIPLTALLYVEIGSHLNKTARDMVIVLHRFAHPSAEKLSGKLATIITAITVLLVGIVFVILMPSLFIHILEDGWSYGESCYFAFTTITTIGFGDYVEGECESRISVLF